MIYASCPSQIVVIWWTALFSPCPTLTTDLTAANSAASSSKIAVVPAATSVLNVWYIKLLSDPIGWSSNLNL